jgi:hypothetical protein
VKNPPVYWTITSERSGTCCCCKEKDRLDQQLLVQLPTGNLGVLHPQCVDEAWLKHATFGGDYKDGPNN